MSIIFETRVSNIPCQCQVNYDPPNLSEFEFIILDRKGYHAPWLERKLDPLTAGELYEQYLVERQAV